MQTARSILSASVSSVCVNPKYIGHVWPLVSHWIKRAMQRGDLGCFADLERDVLCGDALLWLMVEGTTIDGATVSQIIRTEKSKVCMVQACGGRDASKWLHLLADVEQYAKAEGCQCVRIMGRKGWARVLKDYRATKIVLERQL